MQARAKKELAEGFLAEVKFANACLQREIEQLKEETTVTVADMVAQLE